MTDGIKRIFSFRYMEVMLLVLVISLFSRDVLAQRINLNMDEGWRFYKGDVTDAEKTSFDDTSWELINVPHTWNALDGEDGGNNYYRGIGWYRRQVTIGSEHQGKRIYLFFESVGKAADIYCNGRFVGRHEGSYAAFSFDITDTVIVGSDNLIAVKADNSSSLVIAPLSGDFTQWGGICRNVHLIITDPVHISPLDYASPGVYLTQTKVSENSADLRIKTLVRNAGAADKRVTVRATVKDAGDMTVDTLVLTQNAFAEETTDFVQDTTISNPHLWDGLADPYQYKVVVEVETNGTVVDTVEQPLGFRYYSVDPDKGFFLNGRYLDLRGVAIHEDREDKGRAISDVDRQQDIQLMLDMGCTWIRLAHYQHAEKMYDLADENGIVLWTEIPLVNEIASETAFADNCQSQLKELIRQNYNHPSVLFWGIFNEITMKSGPDPTALVRQLNTLAKTEDPTRPTVAASNSSDMHSTAVITDVLGFNKYFGWYNGAVTDFAKWADGIHSKRPSDAIGVSEYGVGASIDQHAENPPQPSPGGPWHPEEYQAYYHEVHWKAMEARPFLWSKTIWNGFDFGADGRAEGDRHGINDKGLVTRDRTVKKDAFYWYQANWSDKPMVYITSRRFTPQAQKPGFIKVYSNCQSVELFINGQSQGVRTAADHIYRWDAPALKVGINEIKSVGSGESKQSCTDSMQLEWTDKKPPNLEIISPADKEKVPGDKDIVIKVNASDPDGKIDRVEFYAANKQIGKTSAAPYNFTWNVPDGVYVITVKAVDDEGFSSTRTVKIIKGVGSPRRPFHGTAAVLPGRLEAEDFDRGLPEEVYHDYDPANQGGRYRPDVGVDIQDCSEGGYDIGWMVAGEWLEYTVNVANTGMYDILFRVGSPDGEGKLHVEFGDAVKTPVLDTPKTGDWQTYTSMTAHHVKLKEGEQVMRVVIDAGSFNFNYIEVVGSSDGKEEAPKLEQ